MSAPMKKPGSQVWQDRLFEAKAAGPAALIEFAKDLGAHQAAQAYKQFRGYKLYRHHITGKILGVITPARGSEPAKPRTVCKPYGRPYWSSTTEFHTLDATNHCLWELRNNPEFADQLEEAYVVPKHAYIQRMLMEVELGIRHEESGLTIGELKDSPDWKQCEDCHGWFPLAEFQFSFYCEASQGMESDESDYCQECGSERNAAEADGAMMADGSMRAL
jgi:hypothetical protein